MPPSRDASSRPPAGASDPFEEELYDAYMDALMAGEAETPAVFLADHPGAGDALRSRLEQLWAAREKAAPETAWTRLGEYRVLERIGEGGMGTVFLGEQESLGRLAALKVLRPEYQGSSTAAARFRREAEIVARLRHPNIVTVYGVGEQDGTRFLAMEFVPGEGLDEAIARGAEEKTPLPVATVVQWGAQIAGALHAAHEAGVVHRDVKPSNIRITPEGRPLLLDFGVALDDAPSRLTVGQAFLGTLLYAAPEQVADATGGTERDADARSDVYSLGVTLYEAVTGRAPFDAGTTQQMVRRMLDEDAPPARRVRSGVPRDLEVVLQKAMEKDPARRYETAEALADDLDAVLRYRPISARPAGPFLRSWKWARRHPVGATALAALVVAVSGFGGLEIWRGEVDRRRRVQDAAALVERARERIREYQRAHAGKEGTLSQLGNLQHDLTGRYLTPEEHAELVRLEREAAGLRREGERAHHEVLEMLRRAERLDPEAVGSDRVRAELHLVRWFEARAGGDRDAARFFAERVAEFDHEGDVAAQIGGDGALVLTADATDASALVHRYERHDRIVADGDPRLVVVPEEPTAVPVIGEPLVLPEGEYLAVVRAEGREDVRVPFRIFGFMEPTVRNVRLPPAGTTPDGFIHVHADGRFAQDDFWFMEREVTTAEYLVFLNDPVTLAAVRASPSTIRVPRNPDTAPTGGHWPIGEDGLYRIAGDWRPDWPAIGVSFEDAQAYAAWRTARADGAEEAFSFHLPTYGEWITAGMGDSSHRVYVWGRRFHPAWTSSCFSQPKADVEPVMSYPIDRSWCGAYDMCGSAFEWLDDWFDESRGLRRLAGGSWARAQPELFRIEGGIGAGPTATGDEYGFRLVARPTERRR